MLIVVILVVAIGIAAIGYIWWAMTGTGPSATSSSKRPGGVLDSDEEVRRVSLGTDMLAAQMAQSALSEQGIETKVISSNEGFLAQGSSPSWLLYRAEDEEAVLAEVEALLG